MTNFTTKKADQGKINVLSVRVDKKKNVSTYEKLKFTVKPMMSQINIVIDAINLRQ